MKAKKTTDRDRLTRRLVEAKPVFSLLFIVFLVAVSYSNTLFSPFMLDDYHSFINDSNIYLRSFSMESLQRLLNTPFGARRFLPILSFSLNHKFFHGYVPYYHLTNISIHLLAAAFLFLFINRLAGKKLLCCRFLSPATIAFISAGLWALNPVQTNAVTYLVQRMASMMAMFYIGSLCFYVYGRTTQGKNRQILLFCLSGVCAVAAFFSKENSATLPIAIIMTETFFISPGLGKRLIKQVRPWQWLGLVGIIVLAAPIFFAILPSLTSGFSTRPFNMNERLLTEARIVIWYISLLLLPLPSRMSLEHDVAISTGFLSPPTTGLSLLAIAMILLFAWKLRHRHRLISFGIFFFFLNLIIESTFIPLELVFEHRLYLPSMGIFPAIAGGMDLLGSHLAKRGQTKEIKKGIVLLTVSVLSLFSVLTSLRNNDWRDQISISRDCVAKAPEKPRALSELGFALAENGNYEEAIKYSKEAIKKGTLKNETYFVCAANVVSAMARMGQNEEAIRQTRRYLREVPPQANQRQLNRLFHNLAYLYLNDEQFTKAYNAIANSLKFQRDNLNPKSIILAVNIIRRAFKAKNTDKESDPKAASRREKLTMFKMAELMTAIGQYKQADNFLTRAAKYPPDDDTVVKARTKLKKIIKINRRQAASMLISNHKPYANLDYRIRWDATNFIIKYYRPLMPLLPHIINSAMKRYPGDIFFTLFDLRYKLDQAGDSFDLRQVKDAVKKHPDFIPLLTFAKDLYLARGEDRKALETIDKIISIYPARAQRGGMVLKKAFLTQKLKNAAAPTTSPNKERKGTGHPPTPGKTIPAAAPS